MSLLLLLTTPPVPPTPEGVTGGGGWWFPNTKRPWELEEKKLRPVLEKIVRYLEGEDDTAPVIENIVAPFVTEAKSPQINWGALIQDTHVVREIILLGEQQSLLEEELMLFMLIH